MLGTILLVPFDSDPDRCPADMAIQQQLGLLP
jgi:hypothetical protein